jgi:hypothetical protein
MGPDVEIDQRRGYGELVVRRSDWLNGRPVHEINFNFALVCAQLARVPSHTSESDMGHGALRSDQATELWSHGAMEPWSHARYCTQRPFPIPKARRILRTVEHWHSSRPALCIMYYVFIYDFLMLRNNARGGNALRGPRSKDDKGGTR